MNAPNRVPRATIRAQFALAMSDMYRREVPMYGTLVDMVQQINHQELEHNEELKKSLIDNNALLRLSAERHGAIRLGKASELFTIRRLFAVMDMYAVSYYDLTQAGIPVHSTAFRPLALEQLNANPFRIFTSLLRLDLLDDEALGKKAEIILQNRQIFTPGLLELVEINEQQQGLTEEQANHFVSEALETFRWHQQATVDMETYRQFLGSHRLLADIVCFKGPHINHLTPRTLNIDHAQQRMAQVGLDPKAIIEGPPRRRCPILLRQTSFKALDEPVEFRSKNLAAQPGSHTARFGEIEQRGMALTPKGRKLYDALLNEVRATVPDPVEDTDAYYQQLELTFKRFPDEIHAIHQQGLAYFNYLPAAEFPHGKPTDLETLVKQGTITIHPITYEDFLPISAAGIFHSNLDERETQQFTRSPNQQAFERDLGCAVIDEFAYYARMQAESLQQCLQQLGMDQAQRDSIIAVITGL